MICPICTEGKLGFCQDTIVTYAMFQGPDGKPDSANIVLESSGLDNTWVECSRCHETSEDNNVLRDIYKRMHQ